jgi:hypothetical protein
MANNIKKLPPMVQYFEKVRDREYIIRRGSIFTWEEVVRTDRLKSELILDIKTDQKPDKIILNGKKLI